MSKDLRVEFEEFITSLTTQISKDLFLEDLKTINKSFSALSTDYKTISQNYTKNINGISNEFTELRNTNTNLNNINNNIDKNSILINKSLETLEGKHRVIIDSIIKDTRHQFDEYDLKIQKLNEEERNKFRGMMIDTISNEFNKSISPFNHKLDNLKVDEIVIKQNALQEKMNKMISKYLEFQDIMVKLSAQRQQEFENRMTELEINVKTINNKTNVIFKQTRIMIIILYLIIGGIGYLWLR